MADITAKHVFLTTAKAASACELEAVDTGLCTSTAGNPAALNATEVAGVATLIAGDYTTKYDIWKALAVTSIDAMAAWNAVEAYAMVGTDGDECGTAANA